MTNARPHALSFAVTFAISSSIISTQALADSRLQIKSVDISGNGQVEFTQSEVIVQPTLGDNQQPIPKSYTTTYPDQAQARAGYDVPSEGFTDVLSGIEGGVSSVDQFETDENDVALKYTKVLRVGDEGVFKFTHDLAEEKLVIEVRKGMTDQNSIEAVRAQSDDIESLEPLTKLASPTQLAGVLKGAHGRAGNLGASDHYVPLADIPVNKVAVTGRTFMRHVVAGDQPPELQRLGQSLFVNDEALLAVATSAYVQVHFLGKNVQRNALKRLLSYQKPVGYVVLVEDGKQAYPAPAGYPWMEVSQASEETIVFHGQKPNPTDIAFVDSHIFRWEQYRFIQHKAKVKKDKIRSYQFVIRSRQMALLEELAAELAVQQDAKLNEDTLSEITYYESFQQALTSDTSDRTDEFELTTGQIRVATSIITPIWMQFQLLKNFSFKPALQNLLINHNFVQSIQKFISLANTVMNFFVEDHGSTFTPLARDYIKGQMRELVSTIEKLRAREAELAGAVKTLDRSITAMAIASDEAELTKVQLKQKFQDELKELRQVLVVMKNTADEFQQDNKRIPELEKQISDDRADATKTRRVQLAAGLNIDDRDGTPPPEKRARLTSQKIDETRPSVTPTSFTATSITPTPASAMPVATTSVAATSVAETSVADDSQPVVNLDRTMLPNGELSQELAAIESRHGLVPVNEADLEARQQTIERLFEQLNARVRTEADKAAAMKAGYTTIAAHCDIDDFDSNADIDVQQARLVEKLEAMKAEAQSLRQQLYTTSKQLNEELLYTAGRTDALAAVLGIDQNDNTMLLDRTAAEATVYIKLLKLKFLDTQLDYIRTGHSEVMPEVLETLSNLEKALQIRAPDDNNDVYLRRQAISENMQRIVRKAIQESEENALEILKTSEEILNIKVNEKHDKTTRFNRIRRMLYGDDLTDQTLDKIDNALWADENTALDGRALKLEKLLAHLHYKVGVHDPDQRAREQRTDPLTHVEEVLKVDLIERNDRAERLARVINILDSDSVREHLLDRIDQTFWKADCKAIDERGLRLKKLDASFTYKVADPYHIKLFRELEKRWLAAIEHQLKIPPLDFVTAVRKVKVFTTKLASDLVMNLDRDASLSDQKDALIARIQAFRDAVNQVYEDEVVSRVRNNEMARQLNIEDYNDDASINDQKSLIEAKLLQLDEEVIDRVQPDVNARIQIIENELDRHLALLRSKPRYVLDREVATARTVLKKAESELETAHQKLDAVVLAGGDDASGDKIRQPIQEQARLEAEIDVRKADLERMKNALKAAEKAVENDGGPFQYTPGQVEVLNNMHDFIHQHALKKQALEAAMGLAASAAKSAKVIPQLSTFDFDDEFAPIRLQAMVGKDLTFHQASRIVRVFRNLKRNFSPSSFELEDDQSQDVLEEVGVLVQRIRNELGKGPQQYDEVINGMGKMAIHFVKYEEEDLKSFLEYFATRSASGNKIITLLREGLISKVELENYIKAVRGVDGYQTVAEFEHFLGDKQGVRVPEFRKVIQMLSDEGAEQFMGIAITPVTVTATGPAGMKESVDGMKEYAAAVIANYVLDDIAFENGRKTAAFLANVQETLTPYANVVGLSQSELIQAIHDTLMQAHAAAVEQQLNDYWVKPSAFLVQAVTWYYTSYKPLLVTHTARQAAELSLSNMSFLYLLDLTNRGDYLHRMLTPFQHWLERYGVDPDRTGQYAYHNGIEQVSEVGGLAMPLGKAASSVILLSTGSMLFARQYNANPHRYRSISRLVPEIVKSMGSRQGVQVPLLHRVTPQKVKTLASATAALVLGPVATVGTYAHGLISGFTYAQTFGVALASSLTFDFFMNDNKMLTQWLGGPLGRSLDKMNRWIGLGETQDEYVKRTAIASPQRFNETDEAYTNRVKANDRMYGWTRHENYLQFRERRDRTMKLFENGWEKYFRENIPKWSFSHAESIPYFYTLGAFYK
ncbi:hypothetical protein [Endozoicomonas sp. 8E]|uniref:hypothetical protein n=1 Tax=Endozoicomonas sp. 8E TaxID=3035692 RepID=UPI002938FDD8|nr:hypothetical protein [Endozoicomonas sp. 8E]WOG29547.1 hypothetical protein P6910_07825 [Endozoicomonas sp. 8E]